MDALFSSNMNIKTGSDKIKILKLEPLSNPQLKRRRSHSHNGAELSNSDVFKTNGNGRQLYLQPHEESSPLDNVQMKPIINNCHSPFINNQLNKDKHKKETHNRVERKRRDFINCQIQKLADLLPAEFFLNCDLKMNKGVILKNSVEYITSMKFVQEINQQLIHENELGAKLIRTLITSNYNDLNCLQLSINENLNYDDASEETDIGILINQWYTIHQNNKQLLQQFTQKFSNSMSNNKESMNNFDDVLMENVIVNDTRNNNSTLNTYVPSRKRYSSLPTNISPDLQSQRCPNANVQLISDKTSPILNSLLKKPNQNNFTHNESLEPVYQIDSNEDGVDFYLRYSASPVVGQNLNTDNALIIDTFNSDSIKECKLFYSKDKTYYILPKSNNSNFTVQLEENPIEENCTNKLNSIDHNDQFIQSNDPMLLSTSPTNL